MIDLRKLKELVRLMVTHELTELDLRDSEEQVTLRRQGPGGPPTVSTTTYAAPAPVPSAPAPAAPAAPDEDSDRHHRIESPMVGTFYAAGSPDASPFVSAGTRVDAESVVCIVEAMKIFNEIKAECSGTIHKVLVKNGEPVEFGQPLYLVELD